VLARSTVVEFFSVCLLACVVFLASGCWRSPCCNGDDECAEYAACFEGTCRARCEHKSECLEDESCAFGVCLALRRAESRCPFTPVDALPLDAGSLDAGPLVDAGESDAGHSLCTGVEEPNDTIDTASTGLFTGTFDICLPGDDDYFAVDARAGSRIDARVTFTHANGDLDIELIGPNGSTLERSQGIGNEERIRRVVAEGRHVLHVYGFADATNTYELSIVVEEP
jgi:hypothetical protein